MRHHQLNYHHEKPLHMYLTAQVPIVDHRGFGSN